MRWAEHKKKNIEMICLHVKHLGILLAITKAYILSPLFFLEMSSLFGLSFDIPPLID